MIGYVAPADTASTVMSELGDAQPLGHHVVVRTWADKPETDALAGRLPDLKDTVRGEVIGAHRRHKQTVVLLHMLATTLGAIGEADGASIQHVSYSPRQSTGRIARARSSSWRSTAGCLAVTPIWRSRRSWSTRSRSPSGAAGSRRRTIRSWPRCPTSSRPAAPAGRSPACRPPRSTGSSGFPSCPARQDRRRAARAR